MDFAAQRKAVKENGKRVLANIWWLLVPCMILLIPSLYVCQEMVKELEKDGASLSDIFYWSSGLASLTTLGGLLSAHKIHLKLPKRWGGPTARFGCACLFVLAGLLGSFTLPAISAAKEHRRITSLQEQAPAASNFCLQHFKEIDKDGNGSISAEEIKTALSSMNLNPKERALLAQVQANFDEVGHIIDSKVEKEMRVVQHLPHPNGFVPPPAFFEVLVTVHSYQINLDDLKSYVARLGDKYGGDNWWTARRKP